MGEWLSQRTFGEMICLFIVVGCIISGIFAAIRGGE